MKTWCSGDSQEFTFDNFFQTSQVKNFVTLSSTYILKLLLISATHSGFVLTANF